MKLKTAWLHGLTDEEKDERKKLVLHQQKILGILKTILEKKLAAQRTAQESKALYDSPNWAYLQADYIASARTLNEVIDLLTIEEESK